MLLSFLFVFVGLLVILALCFLRLCMYIRVLKLAKIYSPGIIRERNEKKLTDHRSSRSPHASEWAGRGRPIPPDGLRHMAMHALPTRGVLTVCSCCCSR